MEGRILCQAENDWNGLFDHATAAAAAVSTNIADMIGFAIVAKLSNANEVSRRIEIKRYFAVMEESELKKRKFGIYAALTSSRESPI